MKGHTGVRIAESVVASLDDLVGVDGNVTSSAAPLMVPATYEPGASARLLGEERPCLRHDLHLFLTWFCTRIPPLACNYLARFTGISSKFREAVRNIPAGVVTRWNSYSHARRRSLLNVYGYNVLQDMITIVNGHHHWRGRRTVCDVAVIPWLRAAKKYMENVFRVANGQLVLNSGIRLVIPDNVKSWQPVFDSLCVPIPSEIPGRQASSGRLSGRHSFCSETWTTYSC